VKLDSRAFYGGRSRAEIVVIAVWLVSAVVVVVNIGLLAERRLP
jgi:hypothetical protein